MKPLLKCKYIVPALQYTIISKISLYLKEHFEFLENGDVKHLRPPENFHLNIPPHNSILHQIFHCHCS